MADEFVKWSDKYNIYAYSGNKKNSERYRLNEVLSPLSKFTLTLFRISLLKKRNSILILPTTQLNLVPLLSLTASKETDGDTLVFGKKETIEKHIKNYCLLNDETGRYVFYNLVPFEIDNDQLEIKIHVPLASKRGIKTEIVNDLMNNSEVNKIYFSSTKYALKTILQNSLIDVGDLADKPEKFHLDFVPKVIIFENIDEVIRDEFSLDIFEKWLKESFKDECNFLFHFSNPYTKLIELFKIKFSSLVFDFNPFFLRKYKQKFQNPEWSNKLMLNDILKKYELDNPNLYTIDYELLPSEKKEIGLYQGNLDIYYKIIINAIKVVQDQSALPIIYKVKECVYDLYNLCIHPANYLVLQNNIGDLGFAWISVEEFFNLMNSERKKLEKNTSDQLEFILKSFMAFYLELKRTKRYFEPHSYMRKSKNSVLLDLLKKIDSENVPGSDLYVRIGIRSRIERRILTEEIEKMHFKTLSLTKTELTSNNLELCIYTKAASFYSENTMLILAGPPNNLRTLCQLLNNNKKIIFIVYKGFNYARLKQMLNDFNNIDMFVRSINYLAEVSKIGLANDIFSIEGYNPEALVHLPEEMPEKQEKAGISTIIGAPNSSSDADYFIDLESLIESTDVQTVSVQKFSKFICIKYGQKIEIEERTPRNLESGDVIVFFGNQRRELLDIFCELEHLNVDVDIEEIKIWRNKITLYIETNEMSYIEFYELYKANSIEPKSYPSMCNWITNRLIGPDSYKDIESMGKVMGDSESVISANYILQQMEKIRKNHLSVGKKLNRIIKLLLAGEGKGNDLDENLLMSKLKLYKIRKIRSRDQKL